MNVKQKCILANDVLSMHVGCMYIPVRIVCVAFRMYNGCRYISTYAVC